MNRVKAVLYSLDPFQDAFQTAVSLQNTNLRPGRRSPLESQPLSQWILIRLLVEDINSICLMYYVVRSHIIGHEALDEPPNDDWC